MAGYKIEDMPEEDDEKNTENDSGEDEEDDSETPMTEEGEPEPQGDVNIPKRMLGGRNYEPGDTITLKVTAAGEHGITAEVQGQGESEAPDAGNEIDAMATSPS